MQRLHQLTPADKTFLLQQIQRGIHIASQHIAYREETGLAVIYHAAVGGDADLAVGAGIQGINGLVTAGSGSQVDKNLGLGSRQVLYVADFNLTLLIGLQDTLDEGTGLAGCSGGLAIGYLCDGQRLIVTFLYLGAHTDHTAALPVIITGYVYTAARGKVGVQMKLLAVQVLDGSLTDFVQVVGQNLTVQTYGNTLGSLCQQQGELNGQGNRLLVTSVVREFPLRSLRVEDHIQGKLTQTRLYVTASCSIVTCDDVTPVSLTVNQQVFLAQLHQRILDAGIAVWVKLHRVTNNIGHLVVTTVIHALHGVHDASLYGFETVTDMGNRTFQDYIRSIIQEPALVHFVKVMGNPIHHVFVLYHQKIYNLPTNIAIFIDSAKLGEEKENLLPHQSGKNHRNCHLQKNKWNIFCLSPA